MAELDMTFLGAPTRMPWAAGQVVHGSTLLTRLATGGMAEIWLARQAGLKGFEKLLVIKRMTDALCDDPEFVEMFLDEARIAAQLAHPGIVQIYDLGEKDGAYFIAMEYLAGENLMVVMREGLKRNKALPIALSTRIVANAAAALGYAHTLCGADRKPLDVVHRDVSPQNILITYDGQTKVLDFGVAKAAHRNSVTQTGKVKGKFAYMSPEHARGDVVDHRSDQFELGIVLYELVTRTRLYKTEDQMQAIAVATAAANRVPAAAKNPAVPQELSDILERAMDRDPAMRFPNCADFAQALEVWLKTQTGIPGAAELQAYMTNVFGTRISDRTRLLERARTNDLTPAARAELPAAAKNQTSGPVSAVSSRRRWGVFAAIAALALAGVGAMWLLSPPKGAPVATIAVETDPPGALLKLDGADIGRSPVTFRDAKPGAHVLTAELEGRPVVSRSLTVAEGERQTVVLTVPAPVPEKPAVEPVHPPAQAAPVAAAAPPAAVKTAARGGKGRLTFDTEPWTQVFVGSRKLGETPLVEVPLPAGSHVLRLVNEAKGISSSVMVEIKPGQPTVMKLKL